MSLEIIKDPLGYLLGKNSGSGGGGTIVSSGIEAYVAVDHNGTMKAQKLRFNGIAATATGDPEDIENTGIYNTNMDEPYNGFIHSNAQYFRCSSVNKANQTWSGYQVIFGSEGEITQDTTLVGNLRYSITPPISGKIYDNTAQYELIEVVEPTGVIPASGLVFYASMNGKTPKKAETGQELIENSPYKTNYKPLYVEEDGIPCVAFNRAAYPDLPDGVKDSYGGYIPYDISISGKSTNIPYGKASRSVSFYVKFKELEHMSVLQLSSQTMGTISGAAFHIGLDLKHNLTFNFKGATIDKRNFNALRWNHICITLPSNGVLSNAIVYINGIRVSTSLSIIDGFDGIINTTQPNYITVGGTHCWFSCLRIYNRVLSQAEVYELANEYDIGSASLGPDCSAKFYKCASVDTGNKTWTGYELVFTDGQYNLSSEITTGLNYTSIIPVTDYIYSQNALIKVAFYAQKMPEEGLVFYAPLSEASDTAVTGQAFTANTEIVYSVEQGVPCMALDNFTAYFADTGLPAGNSSRTMSCWIKRDTQFTSDSEATFFSYGTGEDMKSMDFCFYVAYHSFAMDLYGASLSVSKEYNHTTWHHVLYTYDAATNKACIYVDGILGVSSTSYIPNTVLSGRVYLGVGASNDWPFGQGHIAACRIYDRVLTQDEIAALANEFTPTV